MRYISILCVVGAILFLFGCQPSGQTVQSSSGLDRQSRLLAAENISIKEELDKTKRQLEKQTRVLEQLKEENEKAKQLTATNYAQFESFKKTITSNNQLIADLKKQLETCQNMVEEKGVPALCKYKIQQQRKLLAECEKSRREIEAAQSAKADKWMEQLPTDIMDQLAACTEENSQLQSKIAALEKQIQDANSKPQD